MTSLTPKRKEKQSGGGGGKKHQRSVCCLFFLPPTTWYIWTWRATLCLLWKLWLGTTVPKFQALSQVYHTTVFFKHLRVHISTTCANAVKYVYTWIHKIGQIMTYCLLRVKSVLNFAQPWNKMKHPSMMRHSLQQKTRTFLHQCSSPAHRCSEPNWVDSTLNAIWFPILMCWLCLLRCVSHEHVMIQFAPWSHNQAKHTKSALSKRIKFLSLFGSSNFHFCTPKVFSRFRDWFQDRTDIDRSVRTSHPTYSLVQLPSLVPEIGGRGRQAKLPVGAVWSWSEGHVIHCPEGEGWHVMSASSGEVVACQWVGRDGTSASREVVAYQEVEKDATSMGKVLPHILGFMSTDGEWQGLWCTTSRSLVKRTVP